MLQGHSSRLWMLGSLGLCAVLACRADRRGGLNPPPTPPFISPAVSKVHFVGGVGAPDPAVVSVAINNLAGGDLDSLSVSGISYPVGQPTGWLAAGLSGSPPLLTLQPAVTGLAAGQYAATITLSDPTASNSPAVVDVSLDVSAQPVIGLSSQVVRFNATPGQTGLAPGVVSVTNLGAGTLAGMSLGTIQYAAGQRIGWLATSLSSATAPANVTLTVSTAGLPPGTYVANVPLRAPGAALTPEIVAVTLQVSLAPSIKLSASSVGFTGTAGGANPAPAAVQVSNGGGGTLIGLISGPIQYGFGASGWLTESLAASTAPTQLDLAVNTAGIPAGTYTASVPVQAADTTIPPSSVTVTLTLGARPTVKFSLGTVNFVGLTGSPAPSPQSALVTNSGGGQLTGLAVGVISYGPGGSGWLTGTLGTTTAPATLLLTANHAGLAPGVYTASVPVSSSAPNALGASLQVSLAVSGTAPAAISAIAGNGQTGFVSAPLPIQLRARVYDTASQVFPSAPVNWTPLQGTIQNATTTTDANGEVTATWYMGATPGAQRVQVQTPGVPSLTFSATATALPTGGHPNEPAGYVQITDRAFNAKVENGWTDRGDPAFSIISDPTAPQSLPTVGQAAFALGRIGGTGPIQTGIFTTTQPHSIYIALWIKLSTSWDGHSSYVNKVLHLWINRGNKAYLNLNGAGAGSFTPRVDLQGVNETPVTRNLNPNSGNNRQLTRGGWHFWEVLVTANTPGQPDGIAQWWLDGTQIASYSNINYVPVANQGDFWSEIVWNPTWGGIGDVVPADQWMWIDHIYISGK